MRSPAVGPYDATYSEREILAIETPSAQTPQAAHNTPALDRHELHFHGNAWLEPDGAARKHVQAFAPSLFPVELERGIDLGKMKRRPHSYLHRKSGVEGKCVSVRGSLGVSEN